MIELAILGLLADRDLHGYELKKRLGELPGTRFSVSFGSLYPALGRLEAAELVKAVDAPAAAPRAVPMTGSLGAEVAAFRAALRPRAAGRGRRNKKVYGVTDTGRAELVARLTGPGDGRMGDERGFSLRVAFCRHLRPHQRVALFEGRRAELAARLDRAPAAEPDRRLDTYLRALRDRDTESTRHDLAWLDRLIHAERAAEGGPHHHGGTTP